jgi:hypothetical protein
VLVDESTLLFPGWAKPSLKIAQPTVPAGDFAWIPNVPGVEFVKLPSNFPATDVVICDIPEFVISPEQNASFRYADFPPCC